MVRMRTPPADEVARRWELGVNATPPVPCPRCGRKTKAAWFCQWCKAEWSEGELKQWSEARIRVYETYPTELRLLLRARGHYELSRP